MADADETYPFDVGQRFYTRKVVTASPVAQKWFDRGLCQCYGFNHEEAIRCCQFALQADGKCRMAHWLIAYCCAPNYNKFDLNDPVHVGLDRDVHLTAATESADADADADPIELSLATALAQLLRLDGVAVTGSANDPESTMAKALPMYAAAMAKVYDTTPDDPDVAAVYAQSLMNLRPWDLFVMAPTPDTPAGTPQPGTERILEVLKLALAKHPNHVGLRHLWIHAVEMGPNPESGLDPGRSAAKSMFELPLATVCPDAGHLVHMVSHTDVLCGEYSAAIEANDKSQAADANFVEWHKRSGLTIANLGFYTVYRCHSVHFLVYAAMFGGQQAVAEKAAFDLIAIVVETRATEACAFLEHAASA
mmetsp:Transcript_33223/g.100391  ORF Transcript_33223/g.100391 Transcript_33223/m.100391 type:complete len:364 (+) Transcript_33223:71-1162(+)